MIDEKIMASLQEQSRLKLKPDEEENLARQLEGIIQYFELLSAYDTDGIDPDLGIEVKPIDLRQDERSASVDRDTLESLAVEFDEGFFVVPRILSDESDA